MMDRKMILTRQGFTMIELIAAMVIVGVAVAVAGVGFMSFEHIGTGINARNAQLAQQRLELILAEKRNMGFPASDASHSGPDPCEIHGLGIDACDDSFLTVTFKDNDDNDFCRGSLVNCEVTLTVLDDNTVFRLILYNFN